MKQCVLRFLLFSGKVLFWLLVSNPTVAEIIPDNTLPVNSTVTPSGTIRVIEGGTPRNGNLFHSFREFSFSVLTGNTTGNTAFFNNDLAVRNIITRVTGGSLSNIDGMIRANGAANLFFINPNGIIFGPNASLQIGGSFVASTADSLRFADNTEFSATNPQATPLLTVSVPLGLQFGSNPGRIVNQSQANPDGAVNSVNLPVGLQVPNGKTLALVGGNVSLLNGNLTAAGGRIELASVAGTGLVSLSEIETGYALGYTGIQNFQDIQLSQASVVDTTGEGGGSIQLQGKNIALVGDSQLLSGTTGAGEGRTLAINATESLNLSGNASGILTYTSSTGSAGRLEIATKKLTVAGGAFIFSATSGEGRAGDVFVSASDSVEIIGTTLDGEYPSSIASQVCSNLTNCESVTGNGGNLAIETRQLFIKDGARIEGSTFGAGRAGDIRVTASDFVELIGASPNNPQLTSGIFTQVGKGAILNAGDAGNLTIETRQLSALGGAQISTATFAGGRAGTLTINASDSIQLSGTSPTATLTRGSSGIFVSAEPGATGNVGNLNLTTDLLTVENGARISADNLGSGQGGNATLNLRQLLIRNGGEVRAGSFAEGSGGTLTVNATESVEVIGTGTIASTPVKSSLFTQALSSGKAGNLNITTPNLNVQDGAVVTVSAEGSGSAGNLDISANTIRLNQGSLTATTKAGEGANITLRDLNLLLMQNQSLISAAASENANGGNINIFAPNGSVVALPGQNNDIIASAIEGRGGEINITTSGIFGIEERRQTLGNITNDIDASSEFGLAGRVNINTPNVEPLIGLLELPISVVDASGLVKNNGCAAFADSEGSSFIITGRGGLPPSPNEPLSPDVVWLDTRLSSIPTGEKVGRQTSQPMPSNSKAPDVVEMIPATGWVFNGKGQVTLIAHSQNQAPYGSASTPASCRRSQ